MERIELVIRLTSCDTALAGTNNTFLLIKRKWKVASIWFH
jgi:hypothetical protein